MAVLMNLSSRAFPVIMGPAVPRVSLGFFRPLCCRASGDEALLFVAASCVLFVAVCFVHVLCSLRCVLFMCFVRCGVFCSCVLFVAVCFVCCGVFCSLRRVLFMCFGRCGVFWSLRCVLFMSFGRCGVFCSCVLFVALCLLCFCSCVLFVAFFVLFWSMHWFVGCGVLVVFCSLRFFVGFLFLFFVFVCCVVFWSLRCVLYRPDVTPLVDWA